MFLAPGIQCLGIRTRDFRRVESARPFSFASGRKALRSKKTSRCHNAAGRTRAERRSAELPRSPTPARKVLEWESELKLQEEKPLQRFGRLALRLVMCPVAKLRLPRPKCDRQISAVHLQQELCTHIQSSSGKVQSRLPWVLECSATIPWRLFDPDGSLSRVRTGSLCAS